MHLSVGKAARCTFRWVQLIFAVGGFEALCRSAELQFLKASPAVVPSFSLAGGLSSSGRIIVAAGETLLSSTDDGATWHQGSGMADPGIFYTDVAYNNGVFMAVGHYYRGSFYSSTSRDGITWTTRQTGNSYYVTPMGDGFFESGAGNYAAAGNGVVVYGNSAPPGIVFGQTYLSSGCTSTGCPKVSGIFGAVFINGQFAVSAYNYSTSSGGDPLYRGNWFLSTDGRNWTYGPTGGILPAPGRSLQTPGTYIFAGQENFTFNPFSIVNGQLVAVSGTWQGDNRSFTRFSPDLSSSEVLPIPSSYFAAARSVVFGSSNYVVATDQGSVLTSPDLNKWIYVTNSPVRLTGLAQHGGVVVSVGELPHGPLTNVATAKMMVSTNFGKTSAPVIPPSGTGPLSAVRYGDGKFVAVGGHGTVIRSFDGLTWSKRLSNTSSDLYDLAFGNGLWVAVGASGKIVTSQDAATFYLQFSRTEVDLHSITYAGGQFIAVGADGAILKSANGADWSITGTDEAFDLWGIAYGNGKYVATGTNGIVHVSTDSARWTATTIPGAKLISSVNFWNGQFVATEFNTNTFYVSTDGFAWTAGATGPGKIYGGSLGDDRVWFFGDQSSFWTTPQTKLRGAFTQDGKFSLTIEAPVPGTYQIFSSASLTSQAWSFVTGFTNVQGAFAWTNTVATDAAGFYQVRRQ